ncbi:hypothetical protein BDP27DRAFT_1317424 [Rhodocollybia butyracea]|uniref:Uncharacterized protein n=1 Tax=Rhodocollybia butyracea TaxID=206335 RepID=A0A9P5UBJ1_9AGAR|nr:hypothetical protein BDP27DRAFT_1317424 [Rhodocollybia butyracea]
MSSSQFLLDEVAAIQSLLVFSYVTQMTATVIIWDIVIHIADDVELLCLPGKCRPPTVVYFLSRFFFLIHAFILITDNATVCHPPLTLAAIATSFIAIVFTLFQFFLRVRAIYCEGSRLKTWFFASLWVLASGGASFPVDFVGHSICMDRPVDTSYWVRMSLPVIVILIYDSCVFLAISYQIYKLSLLFIHAAPHFNHSRAECGASLGLSQSLKGGALALAGRKLPSLTRAILQDGQFYYLISVASGAATLAVLLSPSVFFRYRPLLVPLHLVVLNITTGHVFREVKLGRMRERELSTVAFTLSLAFQQSKMPVGETFSI